MCICTYIYISFRYREEKEGGTQRGVRETLTIEAMRHLMSLHKLQDEEEAGRGEREVDTATPLRDHPPSPNAQQTGREGHPGRCNKRAPQ